MKLSCLVKGSIAIIFGLLALLLPEQTLGTFIALFWVFIIAGIVIFLFLATTSRADESMFWFGLSAVFVLIGVVSVLIQGIVGAVFLVLVAGIAFYSGFSDIIFALEHPKTKYVLISGMFLVGALFMGVLFRFYPVAFEPNTLVLTVLGTAALIFGAFSLLIGVYPATAPVETSPVAPAARPARAQQAPETPARASPAETAESDPDNACACEACQPDEQGEPGEHE